MLPNIILATMYALSSCQQILMRTIIFLGVFLNQASLLCMTRASLTHRFFKQFRYLQIIQPVVIQILSPTSMSDEDNEDQVNAAPRQYLLNSFDWNLFDVSLHHLFACFDRVVRIQLFLGNLHVQLIKRSFWNLLDFRGWSLLSNSSQVSSNCTRSGSIFQTFSSRHLWWLIDRLKV